MDLLYSGLRAELWCFVKFTEGEIDCKFELSVVT